MEIVVNEWLLEYLRPDASIDEKGLVSQFLNAVVKKCDKIVIRRPSPFLSKYYRFMKEFGRDTAFKTRFTKLNQLLFHNSDKTTIIDDSDVKPLPREIEEKVPTDDRYLVELAYSSTDRIIVTTDSRLKEELQKKSVLKVYLLEEFLKDYLSS